MHFLPQNFDPNLPIALLAGKGDYPLLMWQKIQTMCPQSFVFSFEEENNRWLKDVDPNRCFSFSIGQVGSWLKALKKHQIRYAILAGQITPKRLFQGLKPDLKAIYLLSRLKEKNATTIFSSLIHEIEKLEIEVLDARSFVEEFLVETGPLTHNKAKINKEYLDKGIHICRTIAGLDIGQSIVVCNGTVIIVEGFDGTDAMIERAGEICNKPMGLIKLAKASQDFRFDVPVFGLRTLEKMHMSGIQWAALESQRTLMLNKSNVIQSAERFGIHLLGF